MYEMYPEAWTATDERRQQHSSSDRPRRRERKEHSVTPAVIAQASQSGTRPSNQA